MLLTENRDPKGFAAVYGLSHTRMCWGGCGCEFSWDLGFCVSLQQAEMGAEWWVPAMTLGCTGWTQQGVFEHNTSVCLICTDPWLLPPKKAFWRGKKSLSCRKHLLRHLFLLSCHLLSCLSDAIGFSHPFSWQMPEPGRWLGARGFLWGPKTCKKRLWWWLAERPELFFRAQPLYSHGFLTRHAVNSWSPQTEEALAYLYCVLASAP